MTFDKGQRVKLSAYGLSYLRFSRQYTTGTRGVVVGFGREVGTLHVLRDGVKNANTYAAEFWEPEA